jgi:tRNA (guanine6-N2)-methyltransferase
MAMPVIKLFALTTRGLESVARAELERIPGISITGQDYRQVRTEIKGDLNPLLALRSVDDVFLLLKSWNDVTHTRDMLARIGDQIRGLPLLETASIIGTVRPLSPQPLFSVSVSFIGKRNYSSLEVKEICATQVKESFGWDYTENDRDADLNLRIFILHDTALVGLRLARSPLHERAYKVSQIPGSLKPSIASAMVELAGVRPGDSVLDPCCGAGTIVIESALRGAVATGCDIDPSALEAARVNARTIPSVTLHQANATTLPIADMSIHHVICNLPWGRQIKVEDSIETTYQRICLEIERVVSSSGNVTLLTPHAPLVVFNSLEKKAETEISVFGQTSSLLLFQKP